MTKTKTDGLVEDAVLYIPRKTIHPDPDQPRVHPDAELQASIDTQGIIQAITVRPHPELENEWMLVDGERRFLGAAHLATIPCRIRLDLEDPAERLITQLTANTGKPLTPIEQARAFKKILDDDPKLSQAELAKRLGIARSTIGDRIRIISLDKTWLDLIDKGKLQVSHGPDLHIYAGVPTKYQAEAAKKIREDAERSKDPISVDGFRWDLQEAFRPFIRELADVSPQYKGPVIEISQYGGRKTKFAADPDLWKPVLAEKQKHARQVNKSSGGQRSQPRFESVMSKAVKELKTAGYDVPVRKSTSYDRLEAKAGETAILADRNWSGGIHPKTLLEKLDPSTLTLLVSRYGSQTLVTSDATAVTAAREAYRTKAAEASKRALAPLRSKLTDSVIDGYRVTGPGAKSLVRYLDPDRGDENIVAMAIDVTLNPDDEDTCSQDDAERLLAALAACQAAEIKIPNSWTVENQIRQAMGNPAFKVEKNKAAPAPKSKKQQKREARAAGKQVGDPKRAKNMRPGSGPPPTRPLVKVGESLGVDVVREATDEEMAEEEELVEA